jgi:hypothetical protein
LNTYITRKSHGILRLSRSPIFLNKEHIPTSLNSAQGRIFEPVHTLHAAQRVCGKAAFFRADKIRKFGCSFGNEGFYQTYIDAISQIRALFPRHKTVVPSFAYFPSVKTGTPPNHREKSQLRKT